MSGLILYARFVAVAIAALLGVLAWDAYAFTTQESAQRQHLYLKAQNRIGFEVVLGDRVLGEVEAYTHTGGTFLPLRALSAMLGVTVTHDMDSEVITLAVPYDERDITVFLRRNEYRIGTRKKLFFGNMLLVDDTEIYVDHSLMARVFP